MRSMLKYIFFILHILCNQEASSLVSFQSGTPSRSLGLGRLRVTSTAEPSKATLRFVSQDEFKHDKPDGRPKLLFLPGLDGIGNYSSQSFANLSQSFDITRLVFDSNDRSSFTDVADVVVRYLADSRESHTLMGESFGGLLAAYVSLRAQSSVSNLILVNPATSYDQYVTLNSTSQYVTSLCVTGNSNLAPSPSIFLLPRTLWPTLGPLVARTGPAFPLVGLSTLLATVIEPSQITNIGQPILDRIKNTEDLRRELTTLWAGSQVLTELLKPSTLEHRLEYWLGSGTFLMNNRYKDITTPTLLLIGTNDR